MGSYTTQDGETVRYTDAKTVELATDLYQYIDHDYKGSDSIDAVRLEEIIKSLRAGRPLEAMEWDILTELQRRVGKGFETWRKNGREGQAAELPQGRGRLTESAEPDKPAAPLEEDRKITHAHLLDSAVHDMAHAALHTERLTDPAVQRDPKSVVFHYDHIIKHVIGAQDHIKRLRDHMAEHPSDPKVFAAEQPELRQQKESTPSPPPNLRNSWTVAPDWRAQNAAADTLDLVSLAEAGVLKKDKKVDATPTTVANAEERKPTVCVDFDGVIHEGPHGLPGHVNGNLVDGAVEGLKKIQGMGYRIVVLTARVDLEAVRDWLKAQGLGELVDEVTNRKPPASAYIDDRATHFTGWKTAAQAVDPLVSVREEPEVFREATVHIPLLAALSEII